MRREMPTKDKNEIRMMLRLELRPEVAASLKKSLKSKKRTSVEKVAAELGLKW